MPAGIRVDSLDAKICVGEDCMRAAVSTTEAGTLVTLGPGTLGQRSGKVRIRLMSGGTAVIETGVFTKIRNQPHCPQNAAVALRYEPATNTMIETPFTSVP